MVQTPMQQVLKISVLIEHYFEHKHLDENIGFVDFLSIHYLSNVRQGDHERDMQLPFKQYSPSFMAFAFYPAPVIAVEDPQPFIFTVRTKAFYRSRFHTSEDLPNIWQPPRSA